MVIGDRIVNDWTIVTMDAFDNFRVIPEYIVPTFVKARDPLSEYQARSNVSISIAPTFLVKPREPLSEYRATSEEIQMLSLLSRKTCNERCQHQQQSQRNHMTCAYKVLAVDVSQKLCCYITAAVVKNPPTSSSHMVPMI